MRATEQCVAKVYPNTRWGAFQPHRCTRKAWKDNFCKTHHPDSVEERREAAFERSKATYAKSPEAKLIAAYEKISKLEEENKKLKEEFDAIRNKKV